MKRIETEINYQATVELTKSNIKIYIIMIILGLALIGLYLALGLSLNFITAMWNIFIMIIGVIFIAFGIIYLFALHKTREKSKDYHVVLKYEFNDKEVKISTYDKESKTNNKIIVAYKDIRSYKESEHYLFLYVSLAKAFPIIKDDNIEQIKEIINIKSIRKKLL